MQLLRFAAVALGLVIIAGCSVDNGIPVGPTAQHQGQLGVANIGDTPIVIEEYYHIRGELQAYKSCGARILCNRACCINNLLEPERQKLFNGGDELIITIRSDAVDPENPDQPLFRKTYHLVVNGSQTVFIDGGNVYTRCPDITI